MTSLAMAAALFLGACSPNGDHSGTPTDDTAAPAVTYYRDVKPILDQNCISCHAVNGTEFPLDSYAGAAPVSEAVVTMTSTKQMPPWPPNEDCAELKNKRSLTDEQIATLKTWSDLGAPAGNPADAVDPQIEQPQDYDMTVEMADSYSPEPGWDDDYRCFVVDPGITDTTFVNAFEVFPGNTDIVHHVIVFVDTQDEAQALDDSEPGAGYTCFGDARLSTFYVMGGWVPGSGRVELPSGTGYALSPGDKLVLQVHYHPGTAVDAEDRTAVGFNFATEPVTSMVTYPILDYYLNIPPNDADHVESDSYGNNYGIGGTVWGIVPHMHMLGTQISVHETTATGEDRCWVDVDDWNFQLQDFYWFQQPESFNPGDRLTIECHYDNTTTNPTQPNDPPQEVHWGEGTGDEMCLAFLNFTVGTVP